MLICMCMGLAKTMPQTHNPDAIAVLLALPCVITGKPVLDTPLCARAEQQYPEDMIFHHTILESESVLDFLRRIYAHDGPFDMDCCIFAHLARRVFQGWNHASKFVIMLNSPTNAGLLWRNKPSYMGYVSPIDADACVALQNTPIHSKGEWVLKLKDGYLGLASDGPKVWSMHEWCVHLTHGITDYISTRTDPRAGVLLCMMQMHKLRVWGVFFELDKPVDLTVLDMHEMPIEVKQPQPALINEPDIPKPVYQATGVRAIIKLQAQDRRRTQHY